eukprot:scaffold4343_cov376-Prasinococcus_capsulatus_cf.AAC.2
MTPTLGLAAAAKGMPAAPGWLRTASAILSLGLVCSLGWSAFCASAWLDVGGGMTYVHTV